MSRRNVLKGENDEKSDHSGAVVAAVAVAGALALGLAYFFPQPEPEPVRPVPVMARPASTPARPQDIQQSLGEWIAQNRDKRPPNEEHVPEALLCKICMSHRISHSFGCGHTTCVQCAVDICDKFGKCPFDQTKLTAVPQRLFL